MKNSATMMAAAVAVLSLCGPGVASARNLRNTLGAPSQDAGGLLSSSLGSLGSVISTQIANQIPTLSTSAGYTYEFNPQLDVYERSAKTFGPLFSERAVTVGAKKFNLNFSYTYIKFDRLNGHDLEHLTSRTIVSKDNEFAGVLAPDRVFQQVKNVTPGLTPENTFTRAAVDLDLEAQLFDLSMTYGVLDNLDVNVDVPILRTFARSSLRTDTLDPRFAALIPAPASTVIEESSARETAIGVGDIRLRAKYLALTAPVRVAGLLDLVLPTGSPGNFQGTGDTRLGTYIILSDTFAEIFEPHLQTGVEFNTSDVGRSQAKYLAGVTAQVASFAAITFDFLGRSEFGAQGRVPSAARLPATKDGVFTENTGPFHGEPVFANISRYDIFDAALGGKVSITPQAIVFATVILPLNNDQGLRSNAVPTVGFEATF